MIAPTYDRDADDELYWPPNSDGRRWPRSWSMEQRGAYLRRLEREVGGRGRDVAAAAATVHEHLRAPTDDEMTARQLQQAVDAAKALRR